MKEYNTENLTEAQLWMIALSAILNEQNGYSHDSIYGGRQRSAEQIKINKECLERDWNISNRQTLMDSLDWLWEDGHRSDFLKARSFFSALSENGQNDYLKAISKESDRYIQYHLIKAYDKKLPQAGILAWDFGRYVFLCRDGAFLGYISNQEAFELMLKVAKVIQKSYLSWKEYGLAYMAGRQFWLKNLSSDSAHWHTNYLSKMLFDKDSPWVKLDWSTKLE